jgi:peptidyl-prolyl cis-trans isomerase D
MLRFLRGANRRTKTIWWVLIIVTVVTFLGGFVVLFGLGAGLDSFRGRGAGTVAMVNGEPISRTDFQNAVNEQRENYRARYGQDPAERDLKSLEVQAYRALIMQRVLTAKAKALGLDAHDREVVLTLQTSPPRALLSAPAFLTDGKFDPEKYRAAMRDPSNNWAPFEEMVREQLPMRKLQERLMSSIKLAEPELRESYRYRFEKVNATVVMIPPATEGGPPNVTDADLQRVYDKYKDRFTSGPQSQLEVLVVAKQFGEAEVRGARELVQSVITRARRGESFAALARDFSEGPGADQGGVVDRIFAPEEFGAELAPKVAAMDTGQVTDPVQDGGRFLFFKILEKPMNPATHQPGIKIAQIVISVKPNDDALRSQYQELQKLRALAEHQGLGRAAASMGVATARTDFYDVTQTPPQLIGVPEAADWGIGAKEKQVSPVFVGTDEFAIVQVLAQKPGGPLPKASVVDRLRQIAQVDVALDRSKPKADAVARALGAGQSLEQAAAAAGLSPLEVDGITRVQPDNRVAGSPELIGALFAARPGQVVGPFRGFNGFYVGRLLARSEPDSAGYEQMKGQVSSELMQSRQRAFFDQYMADLRAAAKVKDLRGEPAY